MPWSDRTINGEDIFWRQLTCRWMRKTSNASPGATFPPCSPFDPPMVPRPQLPPRTHLPYRSSKSNPTVETPSRKPSHLTFPAFLEARKTGEDTWNIKQKIPTPRKRQRAPTSIPNMQEATNSLPSSSERSSSSAAAQMGVKEAMESDEEIRRVPELGGELAGPSTSGRDGVSVASGERAQGGGGAAEARRRKRGGSPADKEHKRLKRLLRNRVSAQLARERKKAYLTELEGKVKDLEKRNSELEERLSTLQNETQMLRQILKNTTVGRKGSSGGGNGEVSA